MSHIIISKYNLILCCRRSVPIDEPLWVMLGTHCASENINSADYRYYYGDVEITHREQTPASLHMQCYDMIRIIDIECFEEIKYI